MLTNAGGRLPGDVFVAKLTDEGSSGAWGWALRAGGLAYERANALAVKDGRVYVGGYFDGPTAAFGGATLTSSGNRDAFVARITDGGTAGQWTWAQKADGLGAEVVTALAVGSGGVYVAGHFNGPTAGFGAVALTSEGIMDGFVAKLTDQGSSGAWGWVQQVGGRGADVPQAVTVDGGTLYVAGYITSDSARFGPTVLVKAGAAGLFVAALADGGATGAWAWGQQGGGAGDDRAVTLARHGSTLYVGGSAGSRTVRFGSHAVTKGGTGPDYSSGFLAALGETPPVVPGEEGCGPLTLWPNPAHDSVRLGGAVTGPLHVVDAVGRLVRTLTLEAKAAGQDSRVLDLRGLPVGVYVLRTGCQQKRLVVD